jgi:4-hydroxybenzoate polyprenyltransferase
VTTSGRTAVTRGTPAAGRILDEFQVSWLFIRNDVWTTLLPGTAFVLAAARYSGHTGLRLAADFLCGLVYLWLYIYGFTLVNQLFGVEEDRINKPFRPLVTGRSTRRGAQARAVAVLAGFAVLGWLLGVFLWAVAWEATYLLSSVTGLERRWFFKNLFIGVGVPCELAAAWGIAAPLTPVAWRWILTLAISIWLLVPLQDLRDIEGDAANGRRTFPMAFGQAFTRWYLAAGFTALPFAVHFLLLAHGPSPWAAAADLVLAGLSLLVAVRVLRFRSPQEDHRTYRRWEQWYALVLVAAIIVLLRKFGARKCRRVVLAVPHGLGCHDRARPGPGRRIEAWEHEFRRRVVTAPSSRTTIRS